ncbi:E3 ubiquitin-protein ligase DTX4 [Hyla sarda]|uniref:E3 ubiquitin-protein ligase DTX4 n=1 Tax=Hyla sarda TaxID=327740 RepID=UPI0024C22C6F|nr:E3 ubiquitin-protein ligase DTX4 [Hyla sarda]
MLDRGAVLVWEWQDKDSLWKPYSPQVAHYIEQVIRNNPKASSVSLGEADASLTPYILDLISMNQFRLDTGTLHPARRKSFPPSTAPGQGIVWEWEKFPGQWVPFETQLSILIQEAFERHQPGVRLGQPCNGSHICFQTMTQVKFPSQKRIRVRARAQIPYPTAGIKCPSASANFHPVVPQLLNGNSKYGSYSIHKIHMNPSQELLDFNKFPMTSNQGLVNSDRAIPTSNKERMNNDHALVNTSNVLINRNQVNMNLRQQTGIPRHDPINYHYALTDFGHTIGNSNHENMNSNQILMNFNSRVVNFRTGPIQSNNGLVNSHDLLVNCNQDVQNNSNELINFEASVINPNDGPFFCTTTPPPSSHWSEKTNALLLESNETIQPQWIFNSDCRYDNCSPALVRSDSQRAASRPALVQSDLKTKELRTDQIRPELVPSNSKAVLNRSNSRHEEYRAELCKPISEPEESKPEFVRSYYRTCDKPEFSRSTSRPSDSRPVLARSNSKPVYERSDSRQAEFRPVLSRAESWNDDTQSAIENLDCRNVDSRPEFVRSNSRPSDARPEFVRSQSRCADSKPGLANTHPVISHSKSTLAGRGLYRSTSLRRSMSPPPCTCPQCHLVQSVKSASWPGGQVETSASWNGGRQSPKANSITRVPPPLPLCNIEGSGMVPPALAGISGLLMSAAGLPVCLSVPAYPIFHPPPVKKRDLRPVPGIQGTSRKITIKKAKKPEEMIKQFLQRVRNSPSEDCTRCKRTLTEGEVGRLYRCGHAYHVRCLAPLYKNGTLRCPTCQTLYGVKIGSQPPGKMTFHVIPHSLPGYPDCETIRIIYYIAPGVQGPGQPHPGMKFTAPDFPLHCFLPNTKKGRKVLLLLIKSWESRLLFPVLPSRVPGVLDTVSITRIPLKTEFGSNVTGKGFPDSRYLDSVLRQLQDWGVSVD